MSFQKYIDTINKAIREVEEETHPEKPRRSVSLIEDTDKDDETLIDE